MFSNLGSGVHRSPHRHPFQYGNSPVAQVAGTTGEFLFDAGAVSAGARGGLRGEGGTAGEVAALEKGAGGQRFHVVYAFENEGRVVYVGKANEVAQTAKGAVLRRIKKGHEHWYEDKGDTFKILAVLSNRDAAAGAEEVLHDYYIYMGAKLRNIAPPLSYRTGARFESTQRKLAAYNADLRRRHR